MSQRQGWGETGGLLAAGHGATPLGTPLHTRAVGGWGGRSLHAPPPPRRPRRISLLWSLGHYHDIELADLPRPSIVLEALARALLAHKDDASIVAAVGGALWTLSLPDSDFARGLRAAAAAPPASSAELCALIPTLVAASKSQALSESARSHAAGALSVLAP